MKKALIAGATGLVGKKIVQELLSNELYQKVTVLSRRELSFSDPKLEVKLIKFDELETLKLKDKFDECYCALGTTLKKSGQEGQQKVDFEYVVKLAELCERNSIPKYLVVSSQGANANSTFFYMRLKGQMEVAVKKVGVETVYIVRPSLILGERDEHRPAEKIATTLYTAIAPLMVGKIKKYRAVSGLQIAKCMIDLAQKDEKGNFSVNSDFIQSY